MILRTPSCTLFPYTTLFRSDQMVSKIGTNAQSGLVLVNQATGPENDFSCSPCRWGDYPGATPDPAWRDRKSTRLNSSHANISYAVSCLKKKKEAQRDEPKPR